MNSKGEDLGINMNLKVRLSQLKNELERLDDSLIFESWHTKLYIETAVQMAEIRIRIKEIEFLTGDLTKNFNKL